MPRQPSFCRRGLRQLGSAGFTLIEVACAAFVLLFAIASSVVAMQTGFRSLDYARGLTLGSQIIQGEVEHFRMSPVEEVQKAYLKGVNEGAYVKEVIAANRKYTVTRVITEEAAAPRFYNVRFVIEWTTTDGMSHSRSTSTRYSENGLNDFFGSNPHRKL